LAELETAGYSLFQPMCAIAVCAQTAACFAVFLKSRNKEVKGVAISAAATGLFGITEPAIYGITLRFKKPFFCGAAGAAVGGIICSLFGTRYFTYVGLAGFLTIPNAIYDSVAQKTCEALGTATPAFSSGVFGAILGTVVACIVSVVLVFVVGFEDPVEENKKDVIEENDVATVGVVAAEAVEAEVEG
jgi:PTS system beta-glucosides-specific IIC component